LRIRTYQQKRDINRPREGHRVKRNPFPAFHLRSDEERVRMKSRYQKDKPNVNEWNVIKTQQTSYVEEKRNRQKLERVYTRVILLKVSKDS
jgi:hypothetical protein